MADCYLLLNCLVYLILIQLKVGSDLDESIIKI